MKLRRKQIVPKTQERKKQQAEWDKENTSQFKIKLNHNTDADIIEYLQALPNKAGYVKDLIRADMDRRKSE